MVQPVCYLDLDGVLVDFFGGALAFHGKSLPYLEARWNFPEQIGMDPTAFWGPLDYHFWKALPWTADGKKILDAALSAFDGRVALVSSPPATIGAQDGKREWVRQNLPKALHGRLFLGRDKAILGGPGKLLVDDHDDNCTAFASSLLGCGGVALTVPRPWNRRREMLLNPAFGWTVGDFCGEIYETARRMRQAA